MISEYRPLLILSPITVLGPGIGARVARGWAQSLYGRSGAHFRTYREARHLMSLSRPVLAVEDLAISYRNDRRWQSALSRISFSICREEIFGLVGESGCGKSTLALQLLGYRHPGSRIDRGRVLYKDQDLLTLPRRELDKIRGNRISFVPQNPTTALNPAIRIGHQITEGLLRHGKCLAADIPTRMRELFSGRAGPNCRSATRYPHELSGGQQQRVCIAMALACKPDLMVLDEPTTGLDVTTQEQILDLLVGLRTDLGMSMLYVTHDLSVLAEIADRVGVMYAGRMVELGPAEVVFSLPRHPYTRGLIASLPNINQHANRPARLLRGLLRRDELPDGCAFQPRCDCAEDSCAINAQDLEPGVATRHAVACQRWRSIPHASPGDSVKPMSSEQSPAFSQSVILSINDLTVAYDGSAGVLSRLLGSPQVAAVSDLSFSMARGETFALVGASGSGKSTVARAISGLLAPRSGQIVMDGRVLAASLKQRNSDELRRIQYIFHNQDVSLNPMSARAQHIVSPARGFLPP